MGAGFNQHSPLRRRNEREKLLFFTAAGLAFALFIIMIVVLSSNRPADARQNQSSSSQIAPALGTVTLYVPERQIRPGTKLSPDLFKEVYWPRNTVPEGAVRDKAELNDQYSKAIMEPGIPVQQSFLSKDPIEDTLPLTPGNRAISIEVDQVSGLEGHATPGTKVDVTLTFTQDQKLTTKIIVQNARVLSYGGYTKKNIDSPDKSSERTMIQNKTITLDVNPNDALQIQTARQMGRLGLLMRTQDDDKVPNVIQVDNSDVGGDKKDKKASSTKSCSKGTVRVAGKELVVGCDGTINQLVSPSDTSPAPAAPEKK